MLTEPERRERERERERERASDRDSYEPTCELVIYLRPLGARIS
jgi:hypothetical protein